jgi:hypothetical protein
LYVNERLKQRPDHLDRDDVVPTSIEEHTMKMKRRDFNRIALGMGPSCWPKLALAQATAQNKRRPQRRRKTIVLKILHDLQSS